MVAASWTTAVSYSFLSLSYAFASQRLYPVAYERQRALTTIGLTFGFVMGVNFLPEMALVTRVVVKSLYWMMYLGCLLIFQVLDKREWTELLSILRGRFVRAQVTE
jgi:hypothetical protein